MLNTKEYNYSYANRIGNALAEPFYKLYKADIKYLETSNKNKVFNTVTILLLNMIAIPLSLPLWFIGKTIVQFTSPKFNDSSLSIDPSFRGSQASMKASLLAMVKNHKETTITEVFSHGAWYSLYDYRMEPNRAFGAIPGLESARTTDSIPEKIHNLLEQQMILTKLRDSNHLIESIQKKINKEADDYQENAKDSTTVSPQEAVDLTMLIKQPQHRKISSGYLVELISKKHTIPLEEAINFVAKNFYSGNNITYQGVHCLLRGIGALS